LFDQQQDEMFKRWSGFGLGMFILFQWLLTFSRVIKKFKKYSFKITNLHKWIGALSPLIFYMHSMELGYGYSALLAYVFLVNTLIGYFNLDVIKSTSETLFKGWMIVHVAFSIIVTILMVFHIGVVFYYK
jgi:cytochrome b561